MSLFKNFLILVLTTLYAFSTNEICYVYDVTDGDSIKVINSDKIKFRVRLIGIDAPEINQAFGKRSKQFLIDKILNQKITLDVEGEDKYNRKLANIYFNDEWINLLMVESGHAWHYVKYSDNKYLQGAQDEAKSNKKGLWKNKEAIPPWKFRKM